MQVHIPLQNVPSLFVDPKKRSIVQDHPQIVYQYYQINTKQAGAELWQAQIKLGRTKLALPFKIIVAFPVLKFEVNN